MRRALRPFVGALVGLAGCSQPPPLDAAGAAREVHVPAPTEVSVPVVEPTDTAASRTQLGAQPTKTAQAKTGTPTQAMQDKIRAGCQARDTVPRSTFLPPQKEHHLAFRYDGTQFVPLPATRKLLDAWKRAAPERWYTYQRCTNE